MSNLTLKARLQDKASSLYNDPGFMTFVDDHVVKLRTSTSTNIVPVEPATALKYQGDLHGLFAEVGVPYFMNFAVMKMNGFDSPTQIQTTLINQLLVPDPTEFKKLFNLWRSHSAVRK